MGAEDQDAEDPGEGCLIRQLAVLALAALAAGCSAEPEAQVETLASVGIVEYGEPEGDDFVFGLVRIDQRFRLDPDAVPDFDALFEALQSSSDRGRSLRVIFDVDSGRFDRDDTLPSYRVHRVEYDGSAFDVWRGYRKHVDEPPLSESSLALGLAYYGSGMSTQALPALEKALAAAGLRPHLRALALKTHGNALLDNVWEQHEVADDADDKQLVRALDDFKQWSALEPKNHEAQLAIGLALRDLGAYEEAIGIFKYLIPIWPEQQPRLVTRIAATYRIMGDFPRAIATIDEFTAGEEPPFGMMLHYHRGWILNLMGRYEEALHEFNEGFKSQPDFSGAFDRRACAYAQLGRLEEALSDRRRADELDETLFAEPLRTPGYEFNRARAKSVNAALEAAIEAGSNAPNAAPCEEFWSHGERKRARSRLLPANVERGQDIGMQEA